MTPTGIPPTGADVPDDARIIADLSCLKCRYNLRGLTAGGACPECGAAILSALTRPNLDTQPALVLRETAVAFAFIQLSIVASPAAYMCGGFAIEMYVVCRGILCMATFGLHRHFQADRGVDGLAARLAMSNRVAVGSLCVEAVVLGIVACFWTWLLAPSVPWSVLKMFLVADVAATLSTMLILGMCLELLAERIGRPAERDAARRGRWLLMIGGAVAAVFHTGLGGPIPAAFGMIVAAFLVFVSAACCMAAARELAAVFAERAADPWRHLASPDGEKRPESAP